MNSDALVGAWDLVAWTVSTPDGVSAPYGADATGLLIYSADGRMSAIIQGAGRQPLSTASPRRAPAVEQAAAFATCFAYAGTYAVVGDDVLHTVTLALNPALVGSVQRRRVALTRAPGARELVLCADEPAGAVVRAHTLRWRTAA